MRGYLRVSNRSAQLSNVPEFMRRFWGACPTRACGFKLLNNQIKPPDRIRLIFTTSRGATPRETRLVVPSAVPVKRILLERADIGAEFDSWRRALSTGNWGTSPEAQAKVATSNASARLASRGGCRGCEPEHLHKRQAVANSIGPARFAAQHRSWYAFARGVAPSNPLLHIYTENLTSSMAHCNATMERVYAYLQLAPMPNNCDVKRLPLEWSCDIRNDPNCSMDKFASPAAA